MSIHSSAMGAVKGPTVNDDGGGGGPGTDELVKVTNTDTTAGFLDDKIVSDDNSVVKSINNPAGNEELDLSVNPSLRRCGNNVFIDKFEGTVLKSFWQGSDADLAGDQSLDAANDKMILAGGLALRSKFYLAHEGDFDFILDMDRLTASSFGVWIFTPDETTALFSLKLTSGNLTATLTGETNLTLGSGGTRFQIRVIKQYDVLTIQYIDGAGPIDPESTSWNTLGTFSGANVLALGENFHFGWDNANNAVDVYEMYMCSNTIPHRINGSGPKRGDAEDAATVTIDPEQGNFFKFTITADRVLELLDGFVDGQMVTLKVIQDGSGGHDFTSYTNVNFSTDLPSPTLSSGAGEWDYLTFIWNEDEADWDFVGKVFGFS